MAGVGEKTKSMALKPCFLFFCELPNSRYYLFTVRIYSSSAFAIDGV